MNSSNTVEPPNVSEVETPLNDAVQITADEIEGKLSSDSNVDTLDEESLAVSTDESKRDSKFKRVEIDARSLASSYPERIDGDVLDRNLEADSNAQYDHTVSQIVDISEKHLLNQNVEKTQIRNKLIIFFISLLSFQMLAVVAFIGLSAYGGISFTITDHLLTVFITSVFVETLGVITIMVYFAFGAKEEVQVVGLLTEIIKNYQKFRRHNKETKQKKD